jgi:hypothetical protein
VDIAVLANDEGGRSTLDPATLTVVTAPSSGRAKVLHGQIRYFTGSQRTVRFQYRVCNRARDCGTAWVTVTRA